MVGSAVSGLTAAEMEAQQRTKWEHAYLSAYATVIFFDDKKTLAEWCTKMPNRKDALSEWSKNGAGILQHTVWTALATEGLGANLQHFPQVTPGADAAMRTVIDIPEEWEVSGWPAEESQRQRAVEAGPGAEALGQR